MADVIARNIGHDGAILIAGNGHVRGDRGVAWYLRRHLPDARILTIGLSEADADQLNSLRGISRLNPTSQPISIGFCPANPEKTSANCSASERLSQGKD